jgi:hypothetical protein
MQTNRLGLVLLIVAGNALLFSGTSSGVSPQDSVARANTSSTASQSSFGRMFPKLPGLTAPTAQQIADLAQLQRDADPAGDNPHVPSGFTYFGQILDHDLTLDSSPQPFQPVDPGTLLNGRTFRFDLDDVYGGGPGVSPHLYEGDALHFRVQHDNGNGVRDLPRNPDGSAILVERRNDENQVISQIHLMLLMAHNRLIDEGHSFRGAQRILQHHYQYATVHDYLPHIVGKATVRRLLDGRRFRCDRNVGRRAARGSRPRSHCLYLRGNRRSPMTPVEFSVAAFRFGHSQVRSAYALNDQSGRIPVFSLTAPDLRGGRPLQAGRHIDWGNFFEEFDANQTNFNVSRRIDPLISSSLFVLPIPGSEASGSNVLAFRNMLRGKFYGLPSGQRVARAMRERVITPKQLALGTGFENGTPLWYYILAEAKRRQDGLRLGPVGGRIVAEVFLSVLDADKSSYLHTRFHPSPRFTGNDRTLTVSDLFEFAGVVEGTR